MWYIITSRVLLLLLFWCIFSLMKKSLQLPDSPNWFHSSLESFSSSCRLGSSLTLPTTTSLQMATPGLAPGKSARKSDRDRPPTDVQLSKFLSYICRHGAEKRGLTVHEGGYINVCDVLELREARKNSYSVSDVQRVVSDCPKQRFSLRTAAAAGGGGGDTLQICANQGHSVEIKGLDLVPILSSVEAPVVVHGTYKRAWEEIKKQGLSKMGRNHVHFAAGLPGEDGVISGMRSSCEVLIYIDVEKALQGGLSFYRSANNVILCSGDERGFISTQYFKRVCDVSKGIELDY